MARHVDTADYDQLVRRIAEFDPNLTRHMRSQLRDAARIAERAVQREIRGWPTHGHKHTELRRRIAQGVTSTVHASRGDYRIYIRQTSRALKPGEASLPRHIDKGTWRHPVYGHRKTWVAQRGHPYFKNQIRNEWPRVIEHAERAINAAAHDLTGKL